MAAAPDKICIVFAYVRRRISPGIMARIFQIISASLKTLSYTHDMHPVHPNLSSMCKKKQHINNSDYFL